MSMISSLIDDLNKSADEWNSSNMFELARMCREAADTIWQLRDDLQRANAAVREAEHDESMAWDRVRKAEAENAKLQVLLEAVLQCAGEIKRDKGCDACPMYNGSLRKDGVWCLLRSTLRELGVEADDE